MQRIGLLPPGRITVAEELAGGNTQCTGEPGDLVH
jgi:hypothetical protein